MSGQSPSQTVGPFFHIQLTTLPQENLIQPGTQGTQIIIHGQVLDGDRQPIDDAMVEIWQADANGFYNHPHDPNQTLADPHFRGFGRAETINSETNHYTFHTIKPGVVSDEDVPFINVRVFARGMLVHANTRLYFADENNSESNVFNSIPPERQHTVVATLVKNTAVPTYRFDIHIQGDDETVFFSP
ncbi:MAG: protocatechuate 3,4-dioxygenase subunit alpha [Chloroflexota bacterium]